MINKIKSLLCIMLLGVSTHCSPMIISCYMATLIGNKARTQHKSESRGFSLSMSNVAPILYTLPGLILGGYALWRVNKHESYTKNEVKALKEGQKSLAERFTKDIDNLHQDVIGLNSDISLIRDDIAILDNDILTFDRLHSDFARTTKNELERYRKLTMSLAEENMLFKEAIGERVDGALFGLKPRIETLESKVKSLKQRMLHTNSTSTAPVMSSRMNVASCSSSKTASTSSSSFGSMNSIESL